MLVRKPVLPVRVVLPLLAGMFLDKPVVDRNAVQTVSRLNRCHDGKEDVVVVEVPAVLMTVRETVYTPLLA